MVQYIIELANAIRNYANKICSENAPQVQLRLPSLVEELNKLDPRDFLPSARYQFVMCRAEARRFIRGGTSTRSITPAHDFPVITSLMTGICQVLGFYGGERSHSVANRDFKFVTDADLRRIINRDYIELKQIVFPSGAWKSTVILAGSILEAILLDQLTCIKNKAKATASTVAPRNKNGGLKRIDKGQWGLASLIEVSVDIRLLTADRGQSVDQVIRDYRNFVHPRKEIRSKHSCSEAEAMMAVGALDGICTMLE